MGRYKKRRSSKLLTVLLLLALILAGLVIALRVFDAKGQTPTETEAPQTPEPTVTPAPTPEPTPTPEPVPPRAADAYIAADPLADVPLVLPEGASADNPRAWYYAVLTRILDEYGRCEAEYEGWGLAFATLLDVDGDGADELYLYYVDDDATIAGVKGYKGKVVHEEVWRGKDCIFRHHHWDSSAVEDEELDSDGRALGYAGNRVSLCAAGRVTHLGEERFRAEQLLLGPEGVTDELRVTASFVANSPSAVLDGDLLAAYGLAEGEMRGGAVVNVFTEGTCTQDGETKRFDYHDCLATFTSTYTEAGGLPSDSEIRVLSSGSNSPLDLLVSLRNNVKWGQQLIYADDYIQVYEDAYVRFHWRLSDIDNLLAQLRGSMG